MDLKNQPTLVEDPASAKLDEFLHAAVHDIRGPLGQVRALTALLERQHKGALNTDGQELCGLIAAASQRAVEIVDSIHAYALVADNPEFETADLDAIVDAACFTLQGPIDRNAAVITRDHLPAVRGDRAKLLLLFQELFRNALKFRGEDPPRIHCSSFRCSGSGNREPSIIFSVVDNGVGIPTKQLDAVFKPLKRLDGEGAGMGLAICRRIVDMHGGKIWVESESMGGADFRFSLPT